MFFNTLKLIECNGVVTYEKGREGPYVDSAQKASFRLVLDQPGHFQFQWCIRQA